MRGGRVAALLAACSLAACKVGPNFTEPKEPVPDHYAGAADPRVSDSNPDSFWWRQFKDPELERLEAQAAAGNLDLKAAFLRIVEARTQADHQVAIMHDMIGFPGTVHTQHA